MASQVLFTEGCLSSSCRVLTEGCLSSSCRVLTEGCLSSSCRVLTEGCLSSSCRVLTPQTMDEYASAVASRNLHFVNAKQLSSKILSSLMDDSCKTIGKGYIDRTKHFVYKNKNVEMAVAFTDATKRTKSTVAGFIVLERGECESLPDVFSVRLICSKMKLGKILMGLALFAIKSNALDKRCVLEVADGYLNPPAFCMYSKFGFQPNIDLYGDKCFSDYSNLPMMVDLTSQTKEEIAEIANGTLNKFSDMADTFCGIEKNKQVYLAIALTLKNYDALGVVNKQNGRYKALLGMIKRRGMTIDELIEMIKTKKMSEFSHLFLDANRVMLSRRDTSSPPDPGASSDFTVSPNSEYSASSMSASSMSASAKSTKKNVQKSKRRTHSLRLAISKTTDAVLRGFLGKMGKVTG